MGKATRRILEMMPQLEPYLPSNDNVILQDEALCKLSDTEQTFLRLAWFFENPKEQNFNLETLYKNLSDDWLSLALELIVQFFKEDTYLMKEPGFSLVTEKNNYYNQSQFADYLSERGQPYSRGKVSTYLSRGKFPQPDLVVAGAKYWTEETCKRYLDSKNQ